MRYTLLIPFSFFVLAKYSSPNQIQTGGTTEKDFDRSLIEKTADSLFEHFNKKTSPGYAVTIIQNGKTLFRKDYGMASIELNIPFSHKTVTYLPYAEGREFISIAAALLEKDGKLTLKNKVRQYFPRLPGWSEAVTIQDLLNHSSGFCDEWATLVLTQAEMSNRLDVSQFLNLLYQQPEPQIEPGAGYMYSNSDFGLLRLIMEKASGEKLPDYLQRRVFEPLKMKASGMRRNKEEVIPNRAFSYSEAEPDVYTVWLRDKTSPGGNYQIRTCADDLEKWALACNDKNSFISKAVERLKENARPIPVLKGINYVFGQKEKEIGKYKLIAHQGVLGYSYLCEIPGTGFTIICLGNNREPYFEKIVSLSNQLLHITTKPNSANSKVFPVKPIKSDGNILSQYAGRYYWKDTGFSSSMERKNYISFKTVDDSLFWLYSPNDIFALHQVGEGIFKDPGYPMWMVFSKSGPDSTIKLTLHKQAGNSQITECIKDTVGEVFYTNEELKKFIGRYYSKHLDFYWVIELNDKGELVVKRPTISDKILEQQPDGEFRLPVQYHTDEESSVWIRFYFNDEGTPVYFDVHHSRLMHCRFDKL